MTHTANDQVSAFFDNEIDDAESDLVLRRLTKDQSLRDCLSRYALIGEAVRRDRPAAHNIAARVRAALDAEPALTPPAVNAGRATQRYIRPLVGAAIAATVAVVAIGSLRTLPTSTDNVPPASIARLGAPVPTTLEVAPVSSVQTANSYTVPAVMPAGHQSVAARRQLNSYLVSHSQYAKRMGPQNIVSFRAVGYQLAADAVPDTTTDQPAVDSTR